MDDRLSDWRMCRDINGNAYFSNADDWAGKSRQGLQPPSYLDAVC